MYLDLLNLHAFRNLDNLSLQLSPRINLITGDNGSGKTSILEAIYFLSTGRSFRTSQYARTIQFDQEQFSLFATSCFPEYTFALGKNRSGKTQLKLDSDIIKSHSELTKLLPLQLIDPESFTFLTAGAQQRARFVDWGAFYNNKAFHKTWQQTKHLIKQRNASLKQKLPKTLINAWDIEIIKRAEALDQLRSDYINLLLPHI